MLISVLQENVESSQSKISEASSVDDKMHIGQPKERLKNDEAKETNQQLLPMETQCQKTAANAKNNLIKVAVREKLARNKEEVSGKRSSFTEIEDSTAENKSSSNNDQQVVNGSYCDKELISQTHDASNGQIKRSAAAEQQHTTWEQEKQKAELAKLTKSSDNLSPNLNLRVKSKQDAAKQQDEDVASLESKAFPNSEIPQPLLPAEETPSKQAIPQIIQVTPDTMTADEAENLLSSR